MLPKFDTNYKPTFQKTQRIQSKANIHTHTQTNDIKAQQKSNYWKPVTVKINLKTK